MSIKVAVRLRPFNQREKEKNETESVIEMNANQTVIRDEMGVEKKFTFDFSFWSFDGFDVEEDGYFRSQDDKYADQRQVYEKVGKEILDNAWEGYHCCLFAYGQTGSGKSYSMVGYGANKGIVPISCDEIFKRIKNNQDPNKSYEVSISMIEIYNEKIQDLFCPAAQRPSGGLKLRENKTLGFYVENKKNYPVTSYEEISQKMEEGNENRTIGSTLMNATSSRAHTIITIEFVQVTFTNGKKSEKRSNINLVDLAGSERASSTGATGDRLKEGCNINKSLLTLGNVINVLADKALGKAKNILPPFRESSLTKILINALGGNSKTVMICALSPAAVNYEETLSTLRYADRAKKIQCKAVINESETDKMIRMLREENLDLKKMIENLNNKVFGGVPLNEDDRNKFIDLKDQYDANQKVMSEMEKSFQERLTEAHKETETIIGGKLDISQPHLIVLNEDPQLSHKLKYSLKELPVYVGRKHGTPTPQIQLSGIGIKVNHAIFKKDPNTNEIFLKSFDPEAKEYIFINGKKLANNEGVFLKHKDKITFGTSSVFLYMRSSDGKDIYDVDWETAHDELQKELEDASKRQDEENEKKKQEEMDSLKKDLEEKYLKEKIDIEEKLKKQLLDYEIRIKEMNQSVEKSRIENERINLENLIKERLDKLESEKARKKREFENKEKNDIIRRENEKKDKEFIHKSEKLEQNLHNIIKKINKLKIILMELKRNINLEVFLSKNILEKINNSKNSQTNILIRVENFEEGTVYYWNTDTFHNRYEMMKELFDKYSDDDYDIFNLKKEDDPLWDDPKPTLLGYGFYKLEPIAYLMSNPAKISIISQIGTCVGQLTCDLIAHDDDNYEYDEVPSDPYDLVGQPLNFTVYIKEAVDVPENFSKNIQVEYNCFVDNMTYKTKVIDEKTKNPVFEERFEHRIEYMTKEDIDYLVNEKLCFKIYAYEEVEMIGKIMRESISNNVSTTNNSQIMNNKNPFEIDSKSSNTGSFSNNPGFRQDNSNNNLNNAPQTRIDKTVLDSFETVPSQKRKTKNEGKSQNKKDCLIY